jgi:predicted nucleic acid-binding protein
VSEVKFLDSSVFIHAYVKSRRVLTQGEEEVKEAARIIISRVERGEPVITTVVHVSEITNIVESRLGLSRSLGLIAGLLSMENIKIIKVNKNDYKTEKLICNNLNNLNSICIKVRIDCRVEHVLRGSLPLGKYSVYY